MALPQTARNDCFRPPKISILVHCLHCGREFDSYLIHWQADTRTTGEGFWCCPSPRCGGIGFGLDIFPVDPHDYISEPGMPELHFCDDDDDDEEDFEDEEVQEQWTLDELLSGDIDLSPNEDDIPF